LNNVLAIVPARSGSRGIPNKNFRCFRIGPSPVFLAISAAEHAGIGTIAVTADGPPIAGRDKANGQRLMYLRRPPALAQDDTPMIDVVQHALEQISGPFDQIVLVLQPTQPLRTPAHLTQAIALMAEADSVVSVTPAESPDKLLMILGGRLQPFMAQLVERRQDARPAYRRDGTVYATRRSWIMGGTLYGPKTVPLIIPKGETCALDDLDDWADAERRLKERAG
jgi:CMP-N,N'-diacetyllegionaminic acid synthase